MRQFDLSLPCTLSDGGGKKGTPIGHHFEEGVSPDFIVFVCEESRIPVQCARDSATPRRKVRQR